MDGLVRWMGLFPERGHRVARTLGCMCRGLRICTICYSALANGLLGQYEYCGLAYQAPSSKSYRMRCRCGYRARKVRKNIEDLHTLYFNAGQQDGRPAFERTYT